MTALADAVVRRVGPRLLEQARALAVEELAVTAGRIAARVGDPALARPCAPRAALQLVSAEGWRRVEGEILGRADLLAHLLAGEHEPEIERAFEAAGVALVPPLLEGVETSCDGPECLAQPCAHVAALLAAFCERCDEDPFALLVWRGRPREELAASLRARRTASVAAPPADEPLPLDASFWRARRDVPWPDAHRPGSARPDALLVELGAPPESVGGDEARDRLAELYRAMATGPAQSEAAET